MFFRSRIFQVAYLTFDRMVTSGVSRDRIEIPEAVRAMGTMFADVILSGAEGKIAKRFSRRIPQSRKQTSIIRGFLRALRLVEMTFFVHRPRATNGRPYNYPLTTSH